MDGSLHALFEERNAEFVFVGGKGGVGKTTCSSALAVQFAQKRQGKVLLISTDPAHNLSDAFMQQFSGEPQAVKGVENLYAMEIDPSFVLEKEVENTTEGLGDEMILEFRQWVSSVPGIDEAMALSAVLKHVESGEYEMIVFDTAPTGHTLRLLQLPQVLKLGLEKLNSWKAKLSGVLSSVTSLLYEPSKQHEGMQKINEKLQKYQDAVTRISEIFRDKKRTQFVCVCIAEHLSVYETRRLVSELETASIRCKYILVNQLVPQALANVTPDTGGASAVARALTQCGVTGNVCNAVTEAVELCAARARIQQKYLGELNDALRDTHTTVRLPLLPAEVRGPGNLLAFSERFLTLDHRLLSNDKNGDETKETKANVNPLASIDDLMQRSAADQYSATTSAKLMTGVSPAQNPFVEGDKVELSGLSAESYNGLCGKIIGFSTEKKRWRVEVYLPGKKKAKVLALKPENLCQTLKSSNNGNVSEPAPVVDRTHVTPEMINLVKKVVMQPQGVQKLLAHPLVEELKKDPIMNTFFTDLEQGGVFSVLKYMSNAEVMGKMAVVAEKMDKE